MQNQAHSIPPSVYEDIGNAFVLTGGALLFIQAALGTIALDLALLIIIEDSAKKNESNFLTGYLLGSLFNSNSNHIPKFDSYGALLFFSVVNSIVAALLLSAHFQTIQITLAVSLAWVISAGMLCIGHHLKELGKTLAAAATPEYPSTTHEPSAPPPPPYPQYSEYRYN